MDDDHRRLVYALVSGCARPEHDNASMQVLPEGEGRCRFVWIHDVLPDELAAPILAATEGGVPVIEQTLGQVRGPRVSTRAENPRRGPCTPRAVHRRSARRGASHPRYLDVAASIR